MDEQKQKFIEWELENDPHCYDKPGCNEFIDRLTLIHVICNVDCPEDVDFDTFQKVLDAVTGTLELFPWFTISKQPPADLELLEASGFEI